MNRKLYDYFLNILALNNGRYSFNTWGSIENATIYKFFKGKKLVEIEGIRYSISEEEGGGVGMGEYPPKVFIQQIDYIIPEHIIIRK